MGEWGMDGEGGGWMSRWMDEWGWMEEWGWIDEGGRWMSRWVNEWGIDEWMDE